MRFRKAFTIGIFLLATVLLSQTGFPQDKGEKVRTFSALIQAVPKDAAYIIINEAKVVVSGAKIVSDTGSVLGIGDLKPRLYVTVEAIKRPDGFYAKKVTVISSSKIPKNVRKTL